MPGAHWHRSGEHLRRICNFSKNEQIQRDYPPISIGAAIGGEEVWRRISDIIAGIMVLIHKI